MAISINIDGNSYELNGLDHPAEEETARKLLTLMEKYAKEDKDLQTKLLKEFKDQLTKLNREVNTLTTATTKPATAPAANRPAANNAPTSAAAKALNNAAGAANNNSKVLNNLTTSAGFATGAVNSMADGLKESTGKFSGALGIAGTALKGIGAAAGFAVTSLVGLGVASLSAFMEASKFQGDLAKGGVRFTESLTALNSASYNAGMTMEQMTAVVKGSSQAISQLGRGGANGAARFAQLVAAARNSADSLRGFGFTAQEEAQARADYLDILRLQGDSETARTMTNGQIIAQSNKMVKGFIGVAAASGKTIDELIKKTKEIAGEDDFGLTIEALGLTAEQSTRVAKNLAVLDAQGLGSLKQVFLEMRTFGTGIGDTAVELKTLGIGGQVENFLDRLDKLEPDQVQSELIKFSQTLPTQAIAEFATKAQMIGGPAAKVANELRRLSQLSAKDIADMAKTAQQKNAALETAKRLEDDTNKLKGMITNVLLRIAESPGFQRVLGQLMYALEEYGPQISDALADVAVGIYEFATKLFTPQGRQEIINGISDAFAEIMVGIKKAILRPIGMYTEEQERAERDARQATNARQMAEVLALKDDKVLNSKQTELNHARIELGRAMLTADQGAIDAAKARIKNAEEDIKSREEYLKKNNPVLAKTQEQEAKAQQAAGKFTDSNTKLAIAAAIGAAGLVGALMIARKVIIGGIERLVLGKDLTRAGGLFGGSPGQAGSAGVTRGADGRYRDAAGKFTKAPVEAPTTAKGVGMSALGDLTKSFTQAAGWLMKGAAIGASLFAIGFGLEKVGQGMQAFLNLDWETGAKAIAAIASLGVVAAVMGNFIVPIGLGAAAIAGLGLALQLFPTGTLEALGKLFESVGAAIGGIVTKIAEGVGLIVDKIAALRNSGIEATTVQIERLSQIPSAQLFATADGVKALKLALDGFGGGFWENVGRGITGFFGADQATQVERMASAMERYKRSISVLSDNGAGEFVLKPIDIGLYTQLQTTLDETKKQINTTFSKKTYEETFVGTTKAIDATYNVKTSKLDVTLEQTRNAIKAAFKPPYEELKTLTDAIKYSIKNATTGITSPTTPTGPVGPGMSRATWLQATKGYFGGSDRVLTGGPTQADIDAYIAHVSTKEGNDNSINRTPQKNKKGETIDPTYAMGKIQLMPSVARGLARDLGYNNLAGISSNKQFAETWIKLSPAEKKKFYEAYARKNYNTIKSGAGRDLTEAEWYAGQFGSGNIINALRDPNASLTPEMLAAYNANIPAFNRGASAAKGGLWNTVKNAVTPNPSYVASSDTPYQTPVSFNTGLSQFTRNEKGQLVPMSKDTKGTITAVSNEANTDEKILNILEQTYNLHVDMRDRNYKATRFKGFTEG
jgi:hypothetical protein